MKDRCPFCKSSMFVVTHYYIGGDKILKECRCSSCGKEFSIGDINLK